MHVVKHLFLQFLQSTCYHFNVILLSRHHEEMSVKIVDHIVDEHNIDIDPEMVKNVKVCCFYWRHLFYDIFVWCNTL